MDQIEAARALGMKTSEITEVVDSEAGTIVHVVDGTQMIIVDEENPDAEGKSGVMFFTAPETPGGKSYSGGFPVYAQPMGDEPAGDAGDGEYPAKGSADAVLGWVAGDQARAQEAYDIEIQAAKSRKGLVEELSGILAQYAEAGS